MNQNKMPSRAVDSRMISRGPDFTPAFADFGRPMSGGRGAAVSPKRDPSERPDPGLFSTPLILSQLMSMGTRRPPPRKIIMNVTVNDDVQLKKAENAWKPGMKRESPPEDLDAQKTQASGEHSNSSCLWGVFTCVGWVDY